GMLSSARAYPVTSVVLRSLSAALTVVGEESVSLLPNLPADISRERNRMTKHSPPVLIVGSVAFDSVKTPLGEVDNVLGGAAVYSSTAASFFSPVQLVGVVGQDFPDEHLEFLCSRGVDLTGLQVQPGETFRWKGYYD